MALGDHAGDVDASVNVALLGATVVEKLWGQHFDPVGCAIPIRGNPFVVVGVLERKGQSLMGQDYYDTAIVLHTTFQTKISSGGLGAYIHGALFVSASASHETTRAQREIETLLRGRHRLAVGMDEDFQVRNLSEIAAAQAQSTGS